MSLFGNARRFFLRRALSVGVELMYMRTDYVGQRTGESYRIQAQGRFDF